jgi:4'-phosphopantetheinyl transferase
MLAEDEVAVWRVSSAEPRPIEAVVARYLHVDPSSVRLARAPTRKPELLGAPLRVSLAHSGEVALVAVTKSHDVGVDVETLRDGVDRWSLVDHALTPRERHRLEAVPPMQRASAFLSMWTRKEALLKAAGVGLAVDPRLVELDGPSIRALPPELGSVADWILFDLPLPNHVGAVAVRGQVSRLRFCASDE